MTGSTQADKGASRHLPVDEIADLRGRDYVIAALEDKGRYFYFRKVMPIVR